MGFIVYFYKIFFKNIQEQVTYVPNQSGFLIVGNYFWIRTNS